MSEVLVAVGTALTGIVGWFSSVLSAIETALGTSVILQIALGVTAVFVGFKILKRVIGVIKGLMHK